MKYHPRLSIIIPVYNKEESLNKCIGSILNQSFSDYEILLIDDGSTDNSAALCESLAKEHQCIRPFHKKNGGVSSARNMGLDNAKGDFVTFVDADDEITPDAYSLMVEKIEREGIDYVFTGVVWIVNGIIKDKPEKIVECEYSKQKMLDYFRRPLYGRSIPGVVFGMFKRQIIEENNIRFRNKIFSREDFLFNTEYVLKMGGNAVLMTKATYKYIITLNNTTSQFENTFNEKFPTGYDATELIYSMMKDAQMNMTLIEEDLVHVFEQIHSYYLKFGKQEEADRLRERFLSRIPTCKYYGIKMKRHLLNTIKTLIPVSLFKKFKQLIAK